MPLVEASFILKLSVLRVLHLLHIKHCVHVPIERYPPGVQVKVPVRLSNIHHMKSTFSSFKNCFEGLLLEIYYVGNHSMFEGSPGRKNQ